MIDIPWQPAALWTCLAVATIGTLVLMRRHWGSAPPISKGIMLSVLAHLVLVGVGYGTRLLLAVPKPPPPRYRVRFVREPGPGNSAGHDEVLQTAVPPAPDIAMRSASRKALAPVDKPEPQVASNEDARPNSEAPVEPPDLLGPTDSDAASRTALNEEAGENTAPPSTVAPMQTAAQTPHTAQMTADLNPSPAEGTNAAAAVVPSPMPGTAMTTAADLGSNAQVDPRHPSDTSQLPDSAPQRNRDPASEEAVARHESGDTTPLHANTPRATTQLRPVDLGSSRPQAAVVPDVYQLRTVADRLAVARQHGGSAETEAAVEAALAWLASAQSEDGRWDADRHGAGVENRALGQDRGGAGAKADTGLTALAILSFLGAGYTHLEGDYQETVRRGLDFLARSQRADGELAGEAERFARMYCHGMATLALSEAWAMTRDEQLRATVENAVRYSVAAQDPKGGSWRYQPRDPGDMSQFGWQVMALHSAQLGGVETPSRTRTGMLRFLQSCQPSNRPGFASYRPGEAVSRTMTAEGLACRVFLDIPIDSHVRDQVTRYLLEEKPGRGPVNFYYYYYGTLAMFELGGAPWDEWNAAMQEQLLGLHLVGGAREGSWDPDAIWGSYGGRVFSTALGALCLEIYYRYLPIYEQARP